MGYDKSNDGNLIINDEEASTVRMIFNMYVAGSSYKDICKILTEENLRNGRGEIKWIPSSIKNILENEKYVGDLIAIIGPSGSGKSILKQIYLLIFRFKLFKSNTSPHWLTDAKIYKKA